MREWRAELIELRQSIFIELLFGTHFHSPFEINPPAIIANALPLMNVTSVASAE